MNAGTGGAVAKAMLVARGVGRCGPALRCSCAPKAGNREECASGRLACAQCAQMGEAESVSQQEFSIFTCHGPRLAERAQMMLHAAMETG